VKKHDYFGAKRLVERAKKTDMGPEGVHRMDEASAQALPVWIRWIFDIRIVLGLVVLVGAIVGFFLFRKRVSSQELSHGT
jgi:hypothetical protein